MYQVRYIRGHVEVFRGDGAFLFSADNLSEAYEMLEESYGELQTTFIL